MPSKRNVSYHAYNAASPMNNRKLAEFDCLLPVWRRGLVFAMGGWTRVLTSGGELLRWMDTKSFPGWLSQRQWDSVTRQAKGALDSWMELRETEFRRVVNGSSLSPDMKRELYDINRRHEWWKPEDDEAHRMARRIIKHLRKQVPFPRMGRCRTMSMDGKIARVEDAMNAVHYRWWVTVSTLDRGRPIRIPIIADPRLEENLAVNNETLANHLQATHTPEEGWTFHVMTTSPKATPRRTGEIIGVDWGVQSLFATSDGRLLGLGLYAWLSERDVELETLTKELNRSHIPCRESKRYRRLNKRIRDHVTNETNRLLNRLGEQDIKEIVVEELDFRHGGLTRRMNRIVSRAGRNAVKRKLQDLQDNKGVTVTKVNPAYTSQECPNCGCTDPRNRKTRDLFRCICCGYTLHADINASRNIRARRSRRDGWRFIGRKQILATLRNEHGERCSRPDHHRDGRHVAKSATTPRNAKTSPEVKAPNGIKNH